MPSFDIVSEVDKMEIENAVNAALKELSTRFDFKAPRRRSSGKPKESKKQALGRGRDEGQRASGDHEAAGAARVDLRNIEKKDPAISPLGPRSAGAGRQAGARWRQGEGDHQGDQAADFKVQNALQERQVRVTGKKRDDLQAVIQFLRAKDFGVG